MTQSRIHPDDRPALAYIIERLRKLATILDVERDKPDDDPDLTPIFAVAYVSRELEKLTFEVNRLHKRMSRREERQAVAASPLADQRIEVSWDIDHGWIVAEPREDIGEMEENHIPDDWCAGDRPTFREAVEWARRIAGEQGLPIRVYHKHGHVTDIPTAGLMTPCS